MAASAGAIRAGSAYVEIFARDGQFQQSMSRIRARMMTLGTQLRQAGTGMTIGGTAIGAPFIFAARTAAAFSLEMARVYNYLLQEDGRPYTIIHGLDGYDEISLTNDTKVITREGEQVFSPEQLGRRRVFAEDLGCGETTEAAAAIFRDILEGSGSWAQNAVVLANAAMALQCTGRYATYDDAYAAAVESLDSGRARAALQKLISLQ